MADIISLQEILDECYSNKESRERLDLLLSSIKVFFNQIYDRFSGNDSGGVNLQIKKNINSEINDSYYQDIKKSDLTDLEEGNEASQQVYSEVGSWNHSVVDLLNDVLLITKEGDSTYKVIENEYEDDKGTYKIIFYKGENEDVGVPFHGAIKVDMPEDQKIIYKGKEYALYYRIKDISKADAGASFNREDGIPWVIPFHNNNGDIYTSVRTDEILSALEYTDYLKQTYDEIKNDINKNYVNLLTDLYQRQVEVEDLDRDFWVISEVITAILNYLFNNNGLFGIQKGILNEIAQLWQNIIYLWSLHEKMNEKPEGLYTHKEFIYIGRNLRYGQFRYDLGGEDDEESIKDYLRQYKKSYLSCNLVLIPIVRKDYYEENFYQTEKIPFIYYYDREKDEETFVRFKWNPEVLEDKAFPIITENKLELKIDTFSDLLENHYYTDNNEDWEQILSPDSGQYQLLKISPYFTENGVMLKVQTIEQGSRLTRCEISFSTNLNDKDSENRMIVRCVLVNEQISIAEPVQVSYYQGELLSKRSED